MNFRGILSAFLSCALLFASSPGCAGIVVSGKVKAAGAGRAAPIAVPSLRAGNSLSSSVGINPSLTSSLTLPHLPALNIKGVSTLGLPEAVSPSASTLDTSNSSGAAPKAAFKAGLKAKDSGPAETPGFDAETIGGQLAGLGTEIEKGQDDGGEREVLERFFTGRSKPGGMVADNDPSKTVDREGKPRSIFSRLMVGIFGSYNGRRLRHYQPIVDKINALEDGMRALSDEELQAKTPEFKERLAKGETMDDLLPEAFAAVREASWRVLKMRHRDVQLIGGIALHKGAIAEMATGEGKTLVAPLAAYLNALSGEGVHIHTVNDYLAKRDSVWMGSIYRFMGLSVGLLQNDMPPAERKPAYDADVTYGTATEFGFDYLRDNMKADASQLVQRGHNFAIIDEVDSVLIDSARTPLIISGPADGDTAPYAEADRVVQQLKIRIVTKEERALGYEASDLEEGYDAVADEKDLLAVITETGYDRIAELLGVPDIYTGENAMWMHYINQALRARSLYRRNVHYLIKDGEVIIVDEFTGRLMEGRQWSEGLHQAIQAKEGLEVRPETRTWASVTTQNFARLYKKLSGMTGTAATSAEEFAKIYELEVLSVPTYKPNIREDLQDRIYRTHAEKVRAVAGEIHRLHAQGRPVLVGTISPEKSEELSKVLDAMGIPHNVLNAKHHEQEAAIVAAGGRLGAVTIATNMAGRGTDILLGGDPHHLARQMMERREDAPDSGSKDLEEARAEVADMVRYGRLGEDIDQEAYARYLAVAKAITALEREQVLAAGGLAVVGTDRHESRRVDLQLMGRSARQGDPGSTQFFLSLDDKLMRLFGMSTIQRVLSMMDWPENEPLEGRMLTGGVEKAQAKVEGRDFSMRDRTLKFDDVLDHQRRAVYGIRRMILTGSRPEQSERRGPDAKHNAWIQAEGGTKDIVQRMIRESIDALIENRLGGKRDIEGLARDLSDRFRLGMTLGAEELQVLSKEEIKRFLLSQVEAAYNLLEMAMTPDILRGLEREILLQHMDAAWMDQLEGLDDLKRGIHLRAYAQKDPVVEYKKDGFEMFEEVLTGIRDDSIAAIFASHRRFAEDILQLLSANGDPVVLADAAETHPLPRPAAPRGEWETFWDGLEDSQFGTSPVRLKRVFVFMSG